jgi:hypothetical protein
MGTITWELTISFLWKEFKGTYSMVQIVELLPRRMRWAGHVVSMVEKRNGYRVSMRKPEGSRSPGRHTGAWENIIKKVN